MFEFIFLTSIFITVGIWEYCMFFRKQNLLPQVFGYGVFSLLLWIFILIGGISMFGILFGILLLIFCMFFLQYFTHFTIGLVLSATVKEKVQIALALFAIMVWVVGIMALVSIFI